MIFSDEKQKIAIYKCQSCKQYTSLQGEYCRFCNAKVDQKAAAESAKQEEDELKQRLAEKNKRQMIHGLITFSLGTVITILSFYVVSERGGYMIIFWGAIFFGGAAFIDGLVGWLQNRL